MNAIRNVLFICTGNSARSIIAEGMLNVMGRGRFAAYSAGSHPKGSVHPLALRQLERLGIDGSAFRSKAWDEFARPDSPPMQFVFTVCDQAAGEACPVWPGQPMTAHWGMPDPAAVEGSDEVREKAFVDTAATMKRRLELFLSLPIDKLDRLAIDDRIRDIGTR